MTPNKRYLLDMSDLLSVRLTCHNCKASLSIPISHRQSIPDTCPHCSAAWLMRSSSDHVALAQFIEGLSVLQSRGKETVCQIQTEIDQPN
jgi:hypothetical protein